MKRLAIFKYVWLGGVMAGCAASTNESVVPRPVSHEASLIEVVSPSEWLISATGYSVVASGDRESEAIYDARCSALNLVLLGGTDPLLQTPAERSRFQSVAGSFFEPKTVASFITWESTKFSERLVIDDGRRIKIIKDFKVNRELLRDHLVSGGIIVPAPIELLSFPTIAVMPGPQHGSNPLEALADADLNALAAAMESHLTARRFDVLIPSQLENIEHMVEDTRFVLGIPEDPLRVIALAAGSDVYLTFALQIDESSQFNSDLRKASVVVRAFETTTGRSLGTETGFSERRPAPSTTLAEEAVNLPMANVISRLEGYWKDDIARGIQYLLHIAFRPPLAPERVRTLQDALAEGFSSDGWANHFKELIITDRSCDYRIWCDPAKISSGRDLARAVERIAKLTDPEATIRTPQINRKLLVMEISAS